MASLTQDVRYGLRVLKRSPGFTAVAVLTLALGIGANATVFSWIQTFVLRPLPGVAESDQIVALVPAYRGSAGSASVSYPDFRSLSELSGVFRGVLGSSYSPALLTVRGTSGWVYGRVATANTFDLLGVRPQLGRLFLPGEDRGEGSHPVLVVSHEFWQRRLGGDPRVIGRTIVLNQHSFEIVGVTPRGFRGTSPALRIDFWAPITMHQEILDYGSFESRTFRWITPLARLREGVSLAQARAAVAALSKRLERDFPDSNRNLEYQVLPLWKSPTSGHAEFIPTLRLLLAVSGALLLIVIVNVANLLLARAAARSKEMAIRLAIGASRGRLVRQMLLESLVLAALGGVLGIALAHGAVDLFSLFIPVTSAPASYEFRVDAVTAAFVAFVTLSSALIFGLVPALRSSRTKVNESLSRSGRHFDTGPPESRVRHLLVVSEVGLALALLVGAVLCLKGLDRAGTIDLGFDPKHVLVDELSLVPSGLTASQGSSSTGGFSSGSRRSRAWKAWRSRVSCRSVIATFRRARSTSRAMSLARARAGSPPS